MQMSDLVLLPLLWILLVRVTLAQQPYPTDVSPELIQDIPIFQPSANYSFQVSESALPDYVVGHVQATTYNRSNILYKLKDGAFGNFFFKIAAKGDILVRSSLTNDPIRERPYYELIIVASIENDDTQTATALVNITVRRNENPPIFTQRVYNGTISEKDPLPINVLSVLATDADGDRITYSITGGDSLSKFYLYPFSGQFIVVGSLQGESKFVYSLNIQASDQRNPAKLDTARVDVTVVRDSANPQFLNIPATSAAILETRTILNGSFFTIQARDADLKGTLTFESLGDGIAESIFELKVVGSDALVFVAPASNLRDDFQSTYQLRVRVYDSVYPNNYDEEVLTIPVRRNMGVPDILNIDKLDVTIWDTHRIGEIILDINATDPDGAGLEEVTSTARNIYNINNDV